MDKHQFADILSNPEDLASINIDWLQSIVDRYPYFQPAQMLLCKWMHHQQDLQYNGQLRLTAAQALDREQLYNLIYKQELRNRIAEIEESIEEEDIVNQTQEVETLEAENDEKSSVHIPIPITKIGKPTKRTEEELDDLEMEILKHAIVTTPVFTPEEIEKTKQEAEANPKTKIRLTTNEKPEESDEPVTDKLKFSAWLHKLDQEKEIKQLPDEPQLSNNDLIDRFISKDPQITKAEFFNPSNMAKLSLVEHDDFVTETLAKVYLKQGNKQKAKNIYKKLMLKYPEKKNYFAAQIEQIDSN